MNPSIEQLTAAGRARSPQVTGGVATDDASRRGPDYSARLRVDHRNSDAVQRGKQIGTYVGLIPREDLTGYAVIDWLGGPYLA